MPLPANEAQVEQSGWPFGPDMYWIWILSRSCVGGEVGYPSVIMVMVIILKLKSVVSVVQHRTVLA